MKTPHPKDATRIVLYYKLYPRMSRANMNMDKRSCTRVFNTNTSENIARQRVGVVGNLKLQQRAFASPRRKEEGFAKNMCFSDIVLQIRSRSV